MKVMMLHTGRTQETPYCYALRLIEQGKAVAMRPKAAKSTKKDAGKSGGAG